MVVARLGAVQGAVVVMVIVGAVSRAVMVMGRVGTARVAAPHTADERGPSSSRRFIMVLILMMYLPMMVFCLGACQITAVIMVVI